LKKGLAFFQGILSPPKIYETAYVSPPFSVKTSHTASKKEKKQYFFEKNQENICQIKNNP
jgi:hypothetical protein